MRTEVLEGQSSIYADFLQPSRQKPHCAAYHLHFGSAHGTHPCPSQGL